LSVHIGIVASIASLPPPFNVPKIIEAFTGFWNHKETHQQYKTETIEAPIIYGRKKTRK
jgi:hypothetical protein